MIELGVLVAFLGGVVSFASPCCLPLVPAYVGYMVGTRRAARTRRRTSLFHGLAFMAGFSVVFVAFWASIGLDRLRPGRPRDAPPPARRGAPRLPRPPGRRASST